MTEPKPETANPKPDSEPDAQFNDFQPGDIVRFRNGNGVVIDGVVQVGRPPAYGHPFKARNSLAVRTFGQMEEQHIAPDSAQSERESDPDYKWAAERGVSKDRTLFTVPPEKVLAVNPDDTNYDEDVTDNVFDTEIIPAPEYLDDRMYDN